MRAISLLLILVPQAVFAQQGIPDSAEAYTKSGNAWQEQGELDNAVDDYTNAIRLNSDYQPAYNNRGTARIRQGEFNKAIRDFTEVIRITPDFALAFNNRGFAREATGKYKKAIKDYSDAIRLKPDYALAFDKLCWLLATCPISEFRDGEKAVGYGEKACELTNWESDWIIGRLSAAYAEAGDFDKATRTLEKAMEMNPEFAKGMRQGMLELYRKGKPYREQIPK